MLLGEAGVNSWTSQERYIVPGQPDMSEQEFLKRVFSNLERSGYRVENLTLDPQNPSGRARLKSGHDESTPIREYKRRKSLHNIAERDLNIDLHMNVTKHHGAFRTKYVISQNTEAGPELSDRKKSVAAVSHMKIRQSVEKVLSKLAGFIGD